MKKTLSDAQEYINSRIEALRFEKESIKDNIFELESKITEIDRLILELRQSFGLNAPVIEKSVRTRKHKETPEEKLARLEQECNTLRQQLGVSI